MEEAWGRRGPRSNKEDTSRAWAAGWLQTSAKENECILILFTYYDKFRECAAKLPAINKEPLSVTCIKHVPIRTPTAFLYACD
jgi:hypothetical protein